MELLWEIAGWSGAVLILSAYLSVSMGWLKAGRRFQAANLIGACAFIVNGAVHEAWPSVVTNIAWFLISAVALLRMRAVTETPAAPVDAPQVQFPGVPDTTGQIAVVEAITAAVHGDVEHRVAECQASLGTMAAEPSCSRSSVQEDRQPVPIMRVHQGQEKHQVKEQVN